MPSPEQIAHQSFELYAPVDKAGGDVSETGQPEHLPQDKRELRPFSSVYDGPRTGGLRMRPDKHLLVQQLKQALDAGVMLQEDYDAEIADIEWAYSEEQDQKWAQKNDQRRIEREEYLDESRAKRQEERETQKLIRKWLPTDEWPILFRSSNRTE